MFELIWLCIIINSHRAAGAKVDIGHKQAGSWKLRLWGTLDDVREKRMRELMRGKCAVDAGIR